MAGKPYSIREMKTIVDYLVEHNAYGEVKGRKMWIDFANTRLTSRTWQSLKETFLKRILPDIVNPYYRLDINQINSFKQGINLTENDKKLDFVPVGDKSNNNDANGDEQQSTSNKEANATGEDTTRTNVVHNRASTETLILENCYETAEDIQRDLERSSNDEQDDKQDDEQNDDDQDDNQKRHKPAVKSLRDFIVYTEPLTPMLQEVLDDFASNEESDRMLIDENYVASERRSNSPEHAVMSQSILKPQVAADNAQEAENGEQTKHENNKEVTENNEQPVNTIEKQVTENHEETVTLSQFEDVMNLVDKALAKHLDSQLDTQKASQGKVQNSHDASSGMTDSLLPNNQEAVNSETFPNASPTLPTPEVNKENQSSKKRKRLSSADIIDTNKTKKQKNVDELITDNRKHSDAEEIIETNEITKQTEAEQVSVNLNKETDYNNVSDQKTGDSGTEKNEKESQKKKKHNLTINSSKTPKEQNKPSPEITLINSDNSEVIVEQSAQVENPCLKSVSLYAEQFSSAKYSDSDVNIVDDGGKTATKKNPEPKSLQVTPEVKKVDDVILLKSHSNSESEHRSPNRVAPSMTMKQRREKIASVFGFKNGGGAQTRKMNGRKRTISHRSHQYISSESSEWTSASDSEYVSPPRGRRYRYPKNRKYFKPHSGRVMSLDDCGGVYVMLGKKIYPLTKQGKNIQTFVRQTSDSDPEEEDNYWKNKYVEERKRTAELKKIIHKSKQNGDQVLQEPETPTEVSPLPPPQQRQSVARQSDNGDELVKRKEAIVVSPEPARDDKTLKIKFTKKDQEIQLEGHWQNINPVLAQVVSMFHKEPAATKQPDPPNCVELSSGTTTPRPLAADTGIKEKINKMESDIFKEIVEKHEADVQPAPIEEREESSGTTAEKDTNVTVRRRPGRPKKSVSPAVTNNPSTNSERSPAFEAKLNDVEEEKAQSLSESPATLATEKRITRTPRKLLDVASNGANASTKQTKTRKSSAKATENEDEEILYKFPSPLPTKRGRKSANVTNNAIETAVNHSKSKIASPEGLSNNSINSNQGYQDSDASPFNIGHRKKRRFSVSTMSLKGRRSYRKSRSKSLPHLVDYETSESSNSSFTISVKSVTQSSVSSEVHRSESYQLLMPRTRKIMQTLDKIEEASNERTLRNVTKRRTSNVSIEIEVSEDQVRTINNEVASSSNLSFPPSPEISIVENISVSKSTITGNEDHPTINEMQSQLVAMNPNNKFLLSEVDVSMPLMAQECSLQKHLMNVLNDFSEFKNAGRFQSTPELIAPKMSMTESILNEMKSVNVEGSLSDSLDRRLEQLLLESAQKSTAAQNMEAMDVGTAVKKNPRSRKRSSTPNKKKTAQLKTKMPQVSIVEEECKARCGRSGRRSCPPSINIVYGEGDVPDNLKINIHEHSTLEAFPVAKRKSAKKDVIKVKILRPKKKAEPKKSKTRTSGAECDNESGVFLQGFDDVSDLIHNHSELCLFNADCTKEKRRDSVEFIETTSRSIITLNSSATPEGSRDNINVNIIIEDRTVTPEMFSDNAQCAPNLVEAKVTEHASPESGKTQYFTPVSPNSSVLTEDLSDETPAVPPKARPTKWYLLSEEDTNTTNSNYFDSCQDETNDVRSFGSNLQQIFPITCAVPDLSTITEMSEKNSPKPGPECRGETDFDSQSMN